jgi:hypothetical protein
MFCVGEGVQRRDMQADLAIYDNVFRQPLVEAAYQVFRELIIPPSLFYMPLSSLRDESATACLLPYLPKQAASYVAHYLSAVFEMCPSDAQQVADGFEFWVGITVRARDEAYLHVDHDEIQRRSGNGLRFPRIGTIFHLGPSSALDGGQTLFDLGVVTLDDSAHCFSVTPWITLLQACSSPIVVPQRQGRLIVFRGNVPHAAGPITRCDPSAPRVTFLANLWERRPVSIPMGVSGLTPEEYGPLRRHV